MINTDSIIPDYDDNSEKAAEYLRMVLPLISKCKIPANPINYSLCYEYVSGKNLPLRETFDRQIQDNQVMTPEFTQQLYKQFILNGASDKFDEIGSGLNALVHQTLDSIRQTESSANSSATAFSSQSAKLANVDDVSEVKDIVQGLIEETKQLANASSGLKTQLNDTNLEIEQLRDELEKMKEAAQTDALTGLLNRRAFDQEMEALMAKSEQCAQKTFLLLMDLDHFKRINDTCGHLVGDKVLRYTAKLLQQFVKDNDMVARYGGEEMAVLLNNIDKSKAIKVANDIREALEKSRLQRKDNGKSIGQVTLSVGLSALKPSDTVEALIGRADTALYQAKDAGRNQVVAI